MLRIMIVDDEAVHLMNMIGVIQVLKPSYIIFSAKDGRQALDILETFQVDLLITDIKMPNMDGLTLIERAKKICPDLYTVILSGYGEFEYARKGIELGVDRYLLKTLEQEDLLQIMDDLEWEVKARQEIRRCEKAQREVIEKVKLDQIERDVEMFVLGYAHDKKAEHIQMLIRDFPSGVVVCAKSQYFSWSEPTINDWKEHIAFFLNPWGKSYSFRCAHVNDAIVTLLCCSKMPGNDFFDQFASFCSRSGNEACVVGVSAFFNHLPDRIDQAYHQATEACEYAFYDPEKALHQYRQESAMQPFLLGHIRLPLESTRDLLLCGNADKASELLIDDARLYINQHRPYPSKFKEVLMFCFWRILSDVGDVICREDIHRLVANIDQLISNSLSVQELEGAIHSACVQFCAILNHQRKSITDQAMEKAAAILREQYARNWSLDDLAKCVHFNPSYFSSIFKQHFGVGYSDFLNDVRMEKAVEFLKESNIQIGRLASTVGYQNTTYFIKSFRMKYGVTPNEFRRGAGDVSITRQR